ncbi:MAG: YraN family protein [Bacteroidota bacterium]
MAVRDHIKLGKLGEEVAVQHLKSKGYLILDRNWRLGHQEIDIIALDGNFIVIVEVKTRNSEHFPEPAACVNRNKQRIQVRTANAWTRYHNHPGEVRFDVIFVLVKAGNVEVNHIMDAFYATL